MNEKAEFIRYPSQQSYLDYINSFRPEVPPDNEEQKAIETAARTMVMRCVHTTPDTPVLLVYDRIRSRNSVNLLLVQQMVKICAEIGAPVDFFEEDWEGLTTMNSQQRDNYLTEKIEKVRSAKDVIICWGPEDPGVLGRFPEVNDAYQQNRAEIGKLMRDGQKDWVMIETPTKRAAQEAGLTELEYRKRVLKTWNKDWESLVPVQKQLIEYLNTAKKIEVIIDERDKEKETHLTWETGNQTVACQIDTVNFPPLQVFSSPKIDSMGGTLYYAKLSYQGKTMEGVKLKFRKGKVYSWSAEKGFGDLTKLLTADDGSRMVGEWALGLNSEISGLESIFYKERELGIIVIALGNAYTNEGGSWRNQDPQARVDNGVRSINHVDGPKPIHKNPDGTGGGRVLIDGIEFIRDGQIVHPGFTAFNL